MVALVEEEACLVQQIESHCMKAFVDADALEL